jgi:prepilin-type N-terminal cleavage/methylation domain-containing protein
MLIKEIKKIFTERHGLSILEIIVAMAIFSLVTAALTGLILSGLSSLQQGNDLIKGNSLAQEGLEAVRATSSRTWNDFNLNRSAITSESGQWELVGEGTTQLIDKFTRTIDFFSVYRDVAGNVVSATTTDAYLDSGSKLVKVLVEWEVRPGIKNKTERNSCLTMARSSWWSQNDWSGGSDQEIWSSPNQYFNDDSLIVASTSNQVTLVKIATSTYSTSGILVSSAFNTGSSSVFVALDWMQIVPEDCNNCFIGVQIKTAPDAGGMPGEWSLYWSGPNGDEDGDEIDYYASSTGQVINSSHNGDQWLQYRVILAGDSAHTPVLQKVRIYYL